MGRIIRHLRKGTLPLLLLAFPTMLAAQDLPSPPLPDGPLVLQTVAGQLEIQILARGMPHLWSLAFLPGGDMLITERGGQLRRLRPGSSQPETITGAPQVHVEGLLGLMEVLPHPQFASNKILYLTWHKKISDEPKAIAVVLARATLDGNRLSGVKELLITDTWDGGGGAGGRLTFGGDGKLYMAVGSSRDGAAQEPGILRGKVLRLNEDGTAPPDNPFVGKKGFRPEIYTWSHRNPSGLAVHPVTRQLWLAEYGPNGGDEINILGAGKNYGWPLLGLGRSYEGPYTAEAPHRDGMERAVADFIPGISPSGLAFYTGKDFPSWTSSAFVGA